MNSKQLNVLLGIVVVILLAAVIYLVVTRPKEDTAYLNSGSTGATTQQKEMKDEPVSTALQNEQAIQPQKQPESAIGVLPTGWKLYTNAKYKFQIGYPKTWTVVDSSNGALAVARTSACVTDNVPPQQLMEQYKDCERFTVWAGDTSKANYSDEDNYFKIKIGGIDGEKFIYNQPTQATIDGQLAFIPKAETQGQVYKNGVWYKFTLTFHQGNINRAIKEFGSFIASFKFM